MPLVTGQIGTRCQGRRKTGSVSLWGLTYLRLENSPASGWGALAIESNITAAAY